ncbi:MAG: hypothetical protein ABIO60_12235, partial [Aquaticitalea sp.]
QQINLPVSIRVPVYENGITINYSLVPVEGDFSSVVTSDRSVFVEPGRNDETGDSRLGYITLNLANISSINSRIVFDVVLTGTSEDGVSIGLAGDTTQKVKRITICPPIDLSGPFFLGDYILTVPSGPSLFDTPVFTEGQIVTLVASGANGTSRQFMAPYLPEFSDSPETLSFSLVNGQIILEVTTSGTSCDGITGLSLGPNTSSVLTTPCDDSAITLNYLDFFNGSGGCGVSDEPIQVLLTKV